MAAITAPLLQPVNPCTQATIIDSFWGPSPHGSLYVCDDNSFEAYFQFYFKECEHALHDGGRHVFARTHQDILDIVNLLKDDRARDEVQDFLRTKLSRHFPNEDELIDSALDLAARLLVMVDVGELPFGYSGRRQLNWTKGCLKDFVHEYFCTPPVLSRERVKLGRIFNAVNLGRIAGVELLPTDNLADHLRLTDDDTKLLVFYHASFLKRQAHNTIFPDGLVDEALRTLMLLFPQPDCATRKLFRQLPAPFALEPGLLRCGYLKTDDRQIEKFTYFHDRLVVLKQLFDDATPRTLTQWWHDRRNGVQWYTFWVAITVLAFTLVFGLIQSIEGALQVYGTFHA